MPQVFRSEVFSEHCRWSLLCSSWIHMKETVGWPRYGKIWVASREISTSQHVMSVKGFIEAAIGKAYHTPLLIVALLPLTNRVKKVAIVKPIACIRRDSLAVALGIKW